MLIWKKIDCYNCGGHGLVSDYGNGQDFYGAAECNTCLSGSLAVSPKDRIAKWPGGPFLGMEPGLYNRLVQVW